MKQEIQESYNLVSSVCGLISTNLETHQKIQAALKLIYDKLDVPEKKKKEK